MIMDRQKWNIVDYKWELKNYPGHLIAVHMDGKHIAYVINGIKSVDYSLICNINFISCKYYS